jgi:methanogenic corrinoid protein MtbC1
MAHLKEEVLVVKISTLLPDGMDMAAVMTDDNIVALRQVIEQLAGEESRTLVEIERA